MALIGNMIDYGFKIYYDDGSTFEGDPAIAPTRGVQVIVMRDRDHVWKTVAGSHYYVWANRGDGYEWFGVDQAGFYDYLFNPGWKMILLGRTISNDRFAEIFRNATEERGIKTGFNVGERQPV